MPLLGLLLALVCGRVILRRRVRTRGTVLLLAAGAAGLVEAHRRYRLVGMAVGLGRPTSILGDIGGFFESLGNIAEDAEHVLEEVFHAFGAVWSFLSHVGSMLVDAWQWIVNGAEWLGSNLESFASEAWTTVKHVALHVVPHAIGWVFHEAWKVTKEAAEEVYNAAKGALTAAVHWLGGLISALKKELESAWKTVTGWVSHAVHFVEHWGGWILNLLTHPDHLANWIAGNILEPVVKWFLQAGADVFGWLLRRFQEDSSELAHVIEDAVSAVF